MWRVDELIRLAAVLFALPSAALAQTQLGAEEFDARTRGKTITYAAPDGSYYGAEQYLDGRRVRWIYGDGECAEGVWYPQGETLCFLYDGQLQHQCWIAEDRGGRLFAYVVGADPAGAISSVDISEKPLPCEAPDLGV